MYKVEDFVIALYCLIEDELYPHYGHHYGRPRRSGFSPSLSDSECLTIEVVGHFLGYSTQKQLYEQMHDQDPRPFHRSLAQYSTETKNPGL